MTDNRLFLLYDTSFDEMDAEGSPGFGYVLVFNSDDAEQFQLHQDLSSLQES